MAYPPRRSCNDGLKEGMTDGSWKKFDMNRGGTVEPITAHLRTHMDGTWHGFCEDSHFMLPDTRSFVNPYRSTSMKTNIGSM